MNREILKYAWKMVLMAMCVVSGCAYFSKKASVQTGVSEQGYPSEAGKVAVPLFLHEKYKAGQGEKTWPDSAITDRFVTGLIQHGYQVLDRARVRKTMRENSIQTSELYHENNIQKIGMLLHADIIVLGKLTLVEKTDGTILSRKLNIRGIRVLDGVVVFSISSIDNTMYRVLTGEDLVDQGVAGMFAPQPGGLPNGASAGLSASGGINTASANDSGSGELNSETRPLEETASDEAMERNVIGDAVDTTGNAAAGHGRDGTSNQDSLYMNPGDEPPPEEAASDGDSIDSAQ